MTAAGEDFARRIAQIALWDAVGSLLDDDLAAESHRSFLARLADPLGAPHLNLSETLPFALQSIGIDWEDYAPLDTAKGASGALDRQYGPGFLEGLHLRHGDDGILALAFAMLGRDEDCLGLTASGFLEERGALDLNPWHYGMQLKMAAAEGALRLRRAAEKKAGNGDSIDG
jgi:hypothetical protein